MTARSHMRGHPVEWSDQGWCWVWSDTKEPTPMRGPERPCVLCGLTPDHGGPDPCLGFIQGASSACCGHGIDAGYIVTKAVRLVVHAHAHPAHVTVVADPLTAGYYLVVDGRDVRPENGVGSWSTRDEALEAWVSGDYGTEALPL